MTISMTEALIEVALNLWASSAVVVPVIWKHENAPAPATDYITLHVFSTAREGRAYVGLPNGGSSNITENAVLTLEVQSFGKSCSDLLYQLRMSLEKPSVQDSLRASGIVYVDKNPISDASETIGSTWEPRDVAEFHFRYAQRDTDTMGTIQSVEMQKIFIGPDLNTITVETVTIS